MDASRKIRVGIVFGGQSAEHEISILSARNVLAALDRTRFEPVLIGIDKGGRWLAQDTQRLLGQRSRPATGPHRGWGTDTYRIAAGVASGGFELRPSIWTGRACGWTFLQRFLRMRARAQALALSAFEVLECEGMARVDLFLEHDGSLLVNEIDTGRSHCLRWYILGRM